MSGLFFNPIELWWSQLKSFLRSFSPTTTEMLDKLISVAHDLINPRHLRNWFANCCYCTSYHFPKKMQQMRINVATVSNIL
ncbi:transposase [Nostoc sp. PCC 7120 = FACHB-418]|nr:transposase [Nostoc sp. PCC 7120 = FACHB-418]